MVEAFKRACDWYADGRPFAMITVVKTNGSVPTRIGDRLIVDERHAWGTVGGGALEKDALERARAMLQTGKQSDLCELQVADLDMRCGGGVTLFIEVFEPQTELWLFGGGHIAKALVPIARSLGFAVTVADNRAEFASSERFQNAAKVLHGDYVETAKRVPQGAFVAIMTHGHAHDEEVLREIAAIDPKLPYVGMIGSTKKVPAILQKLRSEGLALGENIYAPIGLELGGGSPSEIAVSIAAELLAVRHDKRIGPHCRERLVKHE